MIQRKLKVMDLRQEGDLYRAVLSSGCYKLQCSLSIFSDAPFDGYEIGEYVSITVETIPAAM